MAYNSHFSIFSLLSNWQSLFLIVFLLFFNFLYIFSMRQFHAFGAHSGILENI
jgi:hypothetical protein